MLPNTILYQNGKFYTFCCVNGNNPLEIYEISPKIVFRNSWLKSFVERNNTWNNTYISTFRTCPRGYVCEMIRNFGKLYNGLENIVLRREADSSKVIFSLKPLKNSVFHRSTDFLEYFGIVIVVPVDSTKDAVSGEYFVLPFDISVWIICFIFIIYFAIVISILRFLENKHFDFFNNFSYSFLTLLAASVTWKPSKFLHRIIFLTMVFFGIFITTLYNMYLGSFLIKGSGGKEFEIIVNEFIYNLFTKFQNNNINDILWKIVGNTGYLRKSLNMDSVRFGYCLHSNIWSIYNSFQKHLTKRIFRLKYTTSNSMKIDGNVLKPYAEDFRMYLIYIYSSGLIEKWKIGNFFQVFIESVLRNIPETSSNRVSLTWIKYPIFLSIFGYFLGFGIFCIEFSTTFKMRNIKISFNNLKIKCKKKYWKKCKDTINISSLIENLRCYWLKIFSK